jgi:capsular exopolysaccharide synthesis family protein
MSQFFDLLQKLQLQRGDSPSASVNANSQRVEEASQLHQILVDVFPEQGQMDDSSSASVSAHSESIDQTSEFQRIPVEDVHIRPESRIVYHTKPFSAGADRFRFLRLRLQNLWNAGKLRRLLVTSPLPQDGKSTIAMNLATALAEGGKRTVLLIEADLHHPSVTQRLGLKNRPGLAECLESDLNPVSAIRRLAPLGWYLLPAGEAGRSNPTELLQSEAFAGIMQVLSPNFDWILFDSPPVGALTDALSLAGHADASLLVVRAGRTPREDVEQAIELLTPQRVLGVILNGADQLNRLYSKYSAYYGKKAMTTGERTEE